MIHSAFKEVFSLFRAVGVSIPEGDYRQDGDPDSIPADPLHDHCACFVLAITRAGSYDSIPVSLDMSYDAFERSVEALFEDLVPVSWSGYLSLVDVDYVSGGLGSCVCTLELDANAFVTDTLAGYGRSYRIVEV